ncbi:MAG: 4Fe-4S dicluster domain-containing protein [SAR324 cluster bacterium]|nr:4Fe-4S dicluster domain-containing protein [SAR324 cluster bacterium]
MTTGMQRREFFKSIAIGGAVAAVAGCVDKPEKLIPYLVPPDNVEFVPGVPLEYATTCMECPANCGMIVKTREARAIKAEGNPDHPLSRGALCIRGQASLQTHYNPARYAKARRRGQDGWKDISWQDAEQQFVAMLRAAGKGSIVYITGNAAGSRAGFLDTWLGELGAAPKVVLDPLGSHSIRAANKRTFGRAEIPQYRIEAATLLLNFGSDFLETWQNPVENAKRYTEMHAYDDRRKDKGKFVHVGPHLSLTGSNADQWVNVKPGSEAIVALALAKGVLQRRQGGVPAADRTRLAEYLKPYTFARAAKDSGADAGALEKLAQEFSAASPGLAIAGGTALATTGATETQVAVNLLNYVAGNIGKTVVFGGGRQIDPSTPFSEIKKVVDRMMAGEVQLLIVDGANPLYSLPGIMRFSRALERVQSIVSLSSAMDETTESAHLILPGQSFLERWGDAFPQNGVNSLVQPVMATIYPELKAAEDTLLSAAKTLGMKAFKGIGTYRDYLRGQWLAIQKKVQPEMDFESFWRVSLQRGGHFSSGGASTNGASANGASANGASATVSLEAGALTGRPAVVKMAGDKKGMTLLPVPSLRHRDGRGASNPWLQEIADPITNVVWDSWADINPVTAKKMGIAHGDQIRVRSDMGQLKLAVNLHYGVNEDVIAIPLGQGHTSSGRNADLVGVNILDLLPVAVDEPSGDFAYLSTRVVVEATGKTGYLVQTTGSPRQLGRGIIQTQTLEDAKAGKPPDHVPGEVHGERERDMYPKRENQAATPGYYDPYRWGMTVDVDRCTGCSACIAACYAENNIAVVGKTRIGLGREMSWITVQRFFEGEGDNYKTLMQPMFCQQCGNAGCEPVCPVYATYHNPEGLNAQIYNRCVGTRYCSNNCVYKVRRFNWFNYKWDAPLHMQLNPDVTVRTKGVMEKCTFCVQRIRRAKYAANDEGREVHDGEVTPACVQTCPTNALTFGNLSDANSVVTKNAMRGHGGRGRVRQYEVFPELRQLPAVTYLRKVTFEPIEEA